MARKVKWGILGVAHIATANVIPGMMNDPFCEIYGIASRSIEKAKSAASKFNIPKFYGSYEALISDPDIEAVYIPLPNHLHVTYTEACIKAGKHVLCEKPFSLQAHEILPLIKMRDAAKVKVGEAFMVHAAPQWIKAMDIIASKELGTVSSIMGFFSYSALPDDNYRNNPEFGGGALLDIGCYPIHTSRWAFGEEPTKVIATIAYDEKFGIDKLSSAILEFPSGQCIFSCGNQMVPYQRMNIFGTKKRLEVVVPFNPSAEQSVYLIKDSGNLLDGSSMNIEIPTSNQYAEQSKAFNQAIIDDTEVPVTLENAFKNMAVIDALFKSAKSGKWEVPEKI
ncbi:MAG: Gfo/Idh/MocA family protein [Cyclobacteriaceae bacterium]